MLFGLFLYLLLHSNYAQYRVDLLPRRIEWERIRRILSIGIPTGLQYLFEVGAFAAAAVLIGTIGAMPLAAHQVAISLASISYMAASGIGAAASVRVGNAAGRKDPIGIRRTGIAAVVLVLALMGTAGLIFAVFRQQLPAFYSDDAAVVGLSAQLLLVAVFFQFSDGLQALALGLLRGMEDVRIPTWIAFAVYWGFSLPASWLFGLHLGGGVVGIWIVLAVALSLSALLLGWRFHSLSGKALHAQLG
jgi:MATE family multidrug resistance protein